MMFYDIEKCGERIRQLRKENGYTQEKIAKILNVDRSFYSRIESGKNGCSVDLLVQLSSLFCVSLDYLILGKDAGTLLDNVEKVRLKGDIDKLMVQLEQFKATL